MNERHNGEECVNKPKFRRMWARFPQLYPYFLLCSKLNPLAPTHPWEPDTELTPSPLERHCPPSEPNVVTVNARPQVETFSGA